MNAMEAAGPSRRPHLELVQDQPETRSSDTKIGKWKPILDAYALHLEANPDAADPFYLLLSSYIHTRVKPTGELKPLYDPNGVSSMSPLIEAMAAHESPQIKDVAVSFIHVAVQEDENKGFEIAKHLIDDDEDERARELLLHVADLEEGEMSVKALRKVMDALTTHWYERIEGFRVQLNGLRQDSPDNQQQGNAAEYPAA